MTKYLLFGGELIDAPKEVVAALADDGTPPPSWGAGTARRSPPANRSRV
jgi:hypothetical protein